LPLAISWNELVRGSDRCVNFIASELSGAKHTSGENMMKKILLGTVGLIALSLTAPASAADIAARPITKAPPPPPPVYDWSGFYIGVNGGGGSSRKCWDLVSNAFIPGGAVTTFPTPISEGCHTATGGTAGGQIGYRWQASNWVFGIEGQGNWADFRGDNISLVFPTDRNRSRIDTFGLLTGQVGYAWNNALFYVKGGGAVTADRYDIFDPTGALISSARETRWGGTVGVGLEYGFAPNWSVGVEYDHLFMGNRNITLTTPAGLFDGTDRIRQDVDIVTARINWHFGAGGAGWGGPGLAKY
jgi:outer membrane immunogenic protein